MKISILYPQAEEGTAGEKANPSSTRKWRLNGSVCGGGVI